MPRAWPRDFYDLSCERRRIRRAPVKGRYADGQEFQVTTEVTLNPRWAELNQLSKKIRHVLQKKDALNFCLHFLNCALESPMDLSVYINSISATTKAPPSRPDRDDEEDLLINRLESLSMDQLANKVLTQSLKHLSDAIHLRQRECCDRPEYPSLFYRIHYPNSHTFYDDDVGFCCPRWLHERSFDRPSAQDFSDHCNSEEGFQSPYISITESPWCLLFLAKYMPPAEVFIIDAERLWAARVEVKRTTQIAKEWKTQNTGGGRRVHHIAETHWVAQYWIPADCIAKSIPLDSFEKVCRDKGIQRGYENGSMEGRCLELRDFDDAAPRLRRRRVRGAPTETSGQG